MTPYQSPQWKVVRLAVLERDGRVCQLRSSMKCTGYATQAHHINDWEDGGAPFAMSNLIASCRSCNVATRNKRVAARARQYRRAPNG